MQQCTKTYTPLTTLTTAANIPWSGWRDVGRTMIRPPTCNRTLIRRRGSARGIHHMLRVQKIHDSLHQNVLPTLCRDTDNVAGLGAGIFNQNLQKPGHGDTMKKYLKSKQFSCGKAHDIVLTTNGIFNNLAPLQFCGCQNKEILMYKHLNLSGQGIILWIWNVNYMKSIFLYSLQLHADQPIPYRPSHPPPSPRKKKDNTNVTSVMARNDIHFHQG
jgi:hypothetical protein